MDARITSLTPEQHSRIPDFRRKWNGIALSTRPVSRARAKAAIAEIYWGAKLMPPEIIWLPCPLSARMSAVIYSALLNADSLSMSRKDLGLESKLDPAVISLVESAMREDAHGLEVYSQIRTATDYMAHEAKRSASDLGYETFRHQENARYGFDFSMTIDMTGDEVSRLQSLVSDAVCSALNSVARSAVHTAMSSLGRPWLWKAAQERKPSSLLSGSAYPGFCAMLDYVNEVLGAEIDRSFLELSESCGHYWLFDDACFLSERPGALHLDPLGRLHCETGPFIAFESGLRLWHWHGLRVRQATIEQPQKISVSAIEQERNAERRRVMIERYGQARYFTDSGAKLIHEDARGRLWRHASQWDEHVYVEVRNATLEPDGSRKTYFLRVPPEMTNASEAVAWTFGLTAQTYQPTLET
jgi:hypothetical protein